MGHWHYTLQVIRDDQQIVCRVIFYDLNAAVFKESKQARPPGDLEGRRPLSLVFPHWVFRSLGLFFSARVFAKVHLPCQRPSVRANQVTVTTLVQAGYGLLTR